MSSCFEPFRIFVLKTSPAPPRDVCSTTPLAVLHHSLLPRWSALQSRQSTTGTLWAAGSTRSTRIVLFHSLPWVCSLTMTRTSVSNTYYVKCLKHILCQVSQAHTVSYLKHILSCLQPWLSTSHTMWLSTSHTISPSAKTSCTAHYLYRTLSRRRPRPAVAHTMRTTHYLYRALPHTHTRACSPFLVSLDFCHFGECDIVDGCYAQFSSCYAQFSSCYAQFSSSTALWRVVSHSASLALCKSVGAQSKIGRRILAERSSHWAKQNTSQNWLVVPLPVFKPVRGCVRGYACVRGRVSIMSYVM